MAGRTGSYRHRKAIVDLQTKNVPCFDILEKETTTHLVEVWETVQEIVAVTAVGGDWDALYDGPLRRPVWDDVGALLCCILLSDAPARRKLG